MAKELLTRAVTRFYKEKNMINPEGTIGIQDLLFSTPDVSTSAKFSLDKLIKTTYGIAYRNSSNQSVIRHFEPGVNLMITVPRSSEKTPIDEELRDVVAAGKEATDSQLESMAANVEDIIEDHIAADNMTKAKQALDVVKDGVFVARGVNGEDINADYDYGRDAGNSLTYDFTAAGANMNEAIFNILTAMDAKGVPKNNRYAIVGQTWASQFGNDTKVLEQMKANAVNQDVVQQNFMERFGNVHGLYVIAKYRPSGATSSIWILSYEPGEEYVQYKDATPEPFVPVDTAICGSLDDKTYSVKRGVDALTEAGSYRRVVDEMVVDSFTENDPVTTFIRKQTRHQYVPANVNHMFKSVGTF